MKIFKITGIVILTIILIVVVVALFLPSKIHLEHSTEMKSKPETAFGFVNELKKWDQWSPWHEIDTTTKYVFSEPSIGEGAWYTWDSNNPEVRKGKLTLTHVLPFNLIECEMDFGLMGIAKSSFHFDSIAGGVKVTWMLDTDGKGVPWYFYVFSKFINLGMKKGIMPAFEKGLAKMKFVSEAVPQKETVAGFDIEIKNIALITVLSIRDKVKNDEIGKRIGQCYGSIGQYMNKKNYKITSSPLIVIHGMNKEDCDIEFAIPVDSNAKGEGKVLFSQLPAVKALVINYYGAYNKTGPVYEAASNYILSKGKKQSGPPREIYITDPAMEKDTTRWLTQIVFPVE